MPSVARIEEQSDLGNGQRAESVKPCRFHEGNGVSQPQPNPAGAAFLPGTAVVPGASGDHTGVGDAGCSVAAAAAWA
jgi:hypothetical protein